MKIYVASKFTEAKNVRNIMNTLEEKGHTITVDWTVHTNPREQSKLIDWAKRDIFGVKECDLYIGIFEKDFRYTGALVELGTAIGNEKRCWVIGGFINHCIFLNHPLVTCFPDLATALEVIDCFPKE